MGTIARQMDSFQAPVCQNLQSHHHPYSGPSFKSSYYLLAKANALNRRTDFHLSKDVHGHGC